MRCWKQASILKAVALCMLLASSASHSDSAERYQLNVKSQTVEQALRSLANASSRQLLFPYDQMEALKSISISGRYTLEEALGIILKDTSLSGELTTEGVILVTPIQKKSDRGREMNSKKKILAVTIGFFVGAGGVPMAVGQDDVSGGDGKEWLLEEVVVTAQKREERLIDVPISIAVMSGEAIKDAGIQNINDLSYAVPNLSVWEAGPGFQTITIRGVGNIRGSSSLVGIYLDDIPVSAIPSSQIDLQAIDLERVEVLRGPQGTLYGQGSVGGTVRFITQAPSFDGINGDIGLSAYNTKKGGWSEELTGVLNLPVIDDVLAFRVAASYKDKSGWVDQPATGAKDVNNHELSNIRLAGLWQASDDFTLKATAIRHRSDGGFNYANLGPVADSNYRTAVDRTLSSSLTDDYDIYNVVLNYAFDFATLTSISSYIDLDKKQRAASQFLFVPAFSATDELEVLIPTLEQRVKNRTQEIRLSNDDEGPLGWTIGAFYSDSEFLAESPEGASFGLNAAHLVSFPSPPKLQESKSIAYFSDVSYAFTDRLTVGIGTRYFEDQRNYQEGEIKFPQVEFDNLSSKAYLSFSLNDDATVYGNVSEGFRSGGHNNPPSPPFDPEELINYETGIKAALFDKRLNMELAFYYSDYTGYQTSAQDFSVTPPAFVTFNIAGAEIKGVEFNLQWRATQQLSFGFSGNITDAEITEVDIEDAIKEVGDPMDFVPDYSYSLNADYRFNWSSSIPGFIRFDYNRQGKNGLSDHTGGFSEKIAYTESIDFINLNVGAQWGSLSAALFGRNLSDEDRLTTASFSNQGPQNRPRSVGVQLDYEF
ncbi:TonB-dependent receptor [Porticoccaceae bacterium]|nr:TonB-dependent receptor [Porticoccaceae bacterium]